MMFPQTPASSKGKASSVQDSTPPSRLALTNSLNDKAKKRVCDKDPNKNRCLIENCTEERAVEFAHVCPKWFANREAEMDSIEWYWNMARQTLNLDTRWNIMRLGSSIHRLFDKFLWVLAPEENIVDQYYNEISLVIDTYSTLRERFPDIKSIDDFRYKLIPINDYAMRKIALVRQNDPHPQPLTSNDFVIHTYPFDTMPVLKSHVHPKFVILETGLTMLQAQLSDPDGVVLLRDKHPILAKMSRIYQAWTAPRPLNWMEDRTYNLPSPDPGKSEADSEYTEPKRNQPQKRRRYQDVPETPTPAAQNQHASGSGTQGKQRALKQESSICISKTSLKLHDRAIGTGNWTPDSVQKWSETCRPLPEAAHTPWIQLQTGISV